MFGFYCSITRLKKLAAAVWYSGVVILFFKASQLLSQAYTIDDDIFWIVVIIVLGFIVGLIKAKFFLVKACNNNLDRIRTLNSPKIWQFYRIYFFLFLFSMITLGSYLSKIASGNYAFLMSIAMVDISIASGLLASSHCFWKQPA